MVWHPRSRPVAFQDFGFLFSAWRAPLPSWKLGRQAADHLPIARESLSPGRH